MCSLNLSAKVLPDSPIYFITVHPATPEPIDHSTLLEDDISVLGVYQEVLDGVTFFEKHFYPMFSADAFAALTHALYVWDNYIWLVVTAWLVCVFGCPLISACLLLFNLILVMAHSGYLHLLRALLR